MDFGILRLKLFGARNLEQNKNNITDLNPYLIIKTDNSIFRTRVEESTPTPKWKRYISLKIKNPFSNLIFIVKSYRENDEDLYLGRYDFNISELFRLSAENFPNFFHLPMSWLVLNTETYPQDFVQSKSSNSQILIELFAEIPDLWVDIFKGYKEFLEMDYLSCIDRMIHIIDNQFFEKNYVFLLLRAISYFNEKKYELAIRDCSLIIDKLPNNAESFYQKACLQYILNDTQSSKKSLLQASRKQNFSDPKLSKIFTKDIKELENIVTKSEKKNIKNSEKDQFVEKCKKNYFSINSVPRYQTLLIDKITQEEITQLFQEKNLPSVDILGDIIDETDSGDFSQSFLELLTRKRFAKERTNSKKNQIQPQQNSNNINNINTLEN